MHSSKFPALFVAMLMAAACTSVSAQEPAAEAAAGREAAAAARQQELEREAAARAERQQVQAQQAREQQAAALAGQERALQEQQRELAVAREELEVARRRMEEAARQISRLSSVGPRGVFIGAPALTALRSGARLGANIRNSDTGALVLGVTPGGPADEAGIMSGDVIVGVNGTATVGGGREPMDAVIAILSDVEPGAIVSVEVARAGESMNFDVETEETNAMVRGFRAFRDMPEFDVTIPNVENLPNFRFGEGGPGAGRFFIMSDLFASRWRDMELVTLTSDLGSYFGVDAGLLVVRAPEADDLDLRDGDVILQIGDRTPSSPEHAMRILASFAPGETLELQIMRRQRRQTITYTVPDPAADED